MVVDTAHTVPYRDAMVLTSIDRTFFRHQTVGRRWPPSLKVGRQEARTGDPNIGQGPKGVKKWCLKMVAKIGVKNCCKKFAVRKKLRSEKNYTYFKYFT